MSGYFARLLARAQQPVPTVRPQAVLPFATLPPVADAIVIESEPELTGGEMDADIGDAAPRLFTSRDDRPLMPTSSRGEGTETVRASFGDHRPARPLHESHSPSLPSADTDVRGVDSNADQVKRRASHATGDADVTQAADATNVRAPRQTASPNPSRSAPSADADASHWSDTDFRLLPPTPDNHRARGTGADGGGQSAAFARALEDARSQLQRQLAAAQSAPTEVHVTIGRIEVTAAPMAPASPRKAPERAPTVSLEQYLASRARGRT